MKIRILSLAVASIIFVCTTRAAQAAPQTDFRLIIPSATVDAPVTTAYFDGETWDFAPLTYQAGMLEGSAQPGQGGHVIIGAHSELARRKPGPFYHLNRLRPGDQILIIRAGTTYTYTVTSTWTVSVDDVRPLYDTSRNEILTLLTCSGYDGKTYETRLIVRAVRS